MAIVEEITNKVSVGSSLLPQVDLKPSDLPSKFLPYPEDARISYEPYTFGEIERYNNSTFNAISKLEFIMKGIHTNFNKNDLTYFDVLYIGVLRKLYAFGSPEFQTKYICPKCGTIGQGRFKISDIEFRDLDVPELPIEVDDIAGTDLHFSPLTIGKYLDLVAAGKSEDPVAIFAASVINHPFDEAYKIIDGIRGEEPMGLLAIVDELMDMSAKPLVFKCSAETTNQITGETSTCGALVLHDIESLEVLVEPFRDNTEALRNKIRFGKRKDS